MYKNIFRAAALLSVFAFQLHSQEHLTILHWNDFHSQNLPFQVRAAHGDSAYMVGGSGIFAAYLKKYNAGDSVTLKLNAGDDFQGSPISSITKGESQIQLLNLLHPDAMALGNHEFDYGSGSLRQKIAKTTFPVISANLLDVETSRPFAGTYIVRQIGKIKAAIVGLMTPDLKSLSLPENVRSVEVESPIETINRIVPELKRQGVDLIIALTHEGVDEDSILALHAPDVDIIVGGHSHTPLFRPKVVNGIYITQAGSRGRWLGKIDVTIDTVKDTILTFQSRLIECRTNEIKEDSVVSAKALEFEQLVNKSLSKIIGVLKTDWSRTYQGESNIGDWIADAMKAYAKTDIAFQNSGGIRKDLLAGNITIRDIWEISPFGNTLVSFTVSGGVLREMLQFHIAASNDYCQSSGLTVVYRIVDGKRMIHNIKVNGKLLDPAKQYSIVTNNYVAAQSQKYFGVTLDEKAVTQLNAIDRDVLIEAVQRQKTISSSIQGRIKEAEE
ncbi:MAG: bifunctional UDP-sugar hydrolase/5'-nucleotidase [Bacteroidota bacterium]|jgi:2',3'-cyclic-nucleotide 2'-phosphodiesterase (5'-nucleotidase family)